MGYLTQNEIGSNQSMLNRIAQAVAQETQSVEADRYAYEHRRIWSASPSWDSAWESALVTHPEPEYDPGADEGVITDGMILSQVQAMLPPQA